jgi:hypothetical protein
LLPGWSTTAKIYPAQAVAARFQKQIFPSKKKRKENKSSFVSTGELQKFPTKPLQALI